MTSEWEFRCVREIAQHSLGKMLDKAKNRGEPRRYLRNLNVRWFNFDLSDLLEMRFESSELERYSIRKGDLVICEGGYPGRAAIWTDDEPIYFQKALHRVRFHEPEHAKWCLYYLHYRDLAGTLQQHFNGTGIQHFTGEALAKLALPVPPLTEQRRIVATLDEALDSIAIARANAERNLVNAREIFDDRVNRIFSDSGATWKCETIDKHIRFIDYRGRTPEKTVQGLRLITAKNVKKGFIQKEPMEFVAPESYEDWMTRGIPRPGDVLFTTEAPLGNVAQLDTADRVVFAQRVIIMQADPDVLNSTFLKYMLLSKPLQERIHAQATGATALGIKASLLKRIEICFPSNLHEQEAIVAMIDALADDTDRMQDIYKRKLRALDELKTSILHQAFAGQLIRPKQSRVTQQSSLQTMAPEFAANVISIAYAHHERQHREKTFGRVKEQKTLHLVEAIGRIDLGRQPMRDAAGPNDFQHMLKAEDWARAHNFFEMVKRDGGYDFKKLSAFDEHLARAREALKPYLPQLERVIDLLVPMDKEDAEVFATVYAAWNNLVIDGGDLTDGAVVSAAREDWHADKLRISEQKFRNAIALIRHNGLVPDGTAKYVGGQQSLL